ncbi:hypothetical protein NDU88_004473 [Pleurodeles waltl]|uniref:Uncharacterized protein n=1 Tax=Pleurodeles waltl TaxID=8319 RepID=A0AAV7RL39_PLEWA|nr:hypothetical protein NDU88_004473 [Pleurodeles waltl]
MDLETGGIKTGTDAPQPAWYRQTPPAAVTVGFRCPLNTLQANRDTTKDAKLAHQAQLKPAPLTRDRTEGDYNLNRW